MSDNLLPRAKTIRIALGSDRPATDIHAHINSSPAGADVQVDGTYVGTTPLDVILVHALHSWCKGDRKQREEPMAQQTAAPAIVNAWSSKSTVLFFRGGSYTPVFDELTTFDLPVEGAIPPVRTESFQ